VRTEFSKLPKQHEVKHTVRYGKMRTIINTHVCSSLMMYNTDGNKNLS